MGCFRSAPFPGAFSWDKAVREWGSCTGEAPFMDCQVNMAAKNRIITRGPPGRSGSGAGGPAGMLPPGPGPPAARSM